ncbi:hypothetical protein QQ045_003237 [Rhodiola kirilowii]
MFIIAQVHSATRRKNRPTEGGLGIKNLKTFNDALVMKQLWDFHENKRNLWVEWLKAYWSKGRDWWLDSVESKSSWILQRLSYCK